MYARLIIYRMIRTLLFTTGLFLGLLSALSITYAQTNDIAIVGLDASSYPVIQLTVDADKLITDEDGRTCSLTIVENNQPVMTTTLQQVSLSTTPTKRRIAFILDLTTYEVNLAIRESIAAALAHLTRLCTWGADDQFAVFVPDEAQGQALTPLVAWTKERDRIIDPVRNYPSAPDGNSIFTDPDQLVTQLLATPEYSTAPTGTLDTVILFSNGIDKNGIDTQQLETALKNQAVDLFVIFVAKDDSARNFGNVAALTRDNVSHYADLRNSVRMEQLWQSLVNADVLHRLIYTTTLPPPFSIALQGKSSTGPISSLVKPVLTEFKPYDIEIIQPRPGSVFTTLAEAPTITAIVAISAPTSSRHYYPYTLDYKVNADPYTRTLTATYTAAISTNHRIMITLPTRTQTTPLFYTLDFRVIEEQTGLRNTASTFFTPPKASVVRWPKPWTDLQQIWQWLLSLWTYFTDLWRENLWVRLLLLIQVVPLLFAIVTLFRNWQWRYHYYQLEGKLDKTHNQLNNLSRRLSLQQSQKEDHSTRIWPTPPDIPAELILLQGEGTLYDYIALSGVRTKLGTKVPSTHVADEEYWILKNPWLDDTHCVIEAKQGQYWIYDGDGPDSNQPSKNGLFVNNQRVPPEGVKLKSGDVIGLSRAVRYSFRTNQGSTEVTVSLLPSKSGGNTHLQSGFVAGNNQQQ